MKHTGSTLLIMLAVATAIGGFLGSRNRTFVSRSPYGKVSLSKEEKRLLYKPLDPNLRNQRYNIPKAYALAIICIKHRLNRSEILELTAMRPNHEVLDGPDGISAMGYHFAGQGALTFTFDQNGNLMSVHGMDGLPTLESVTPDTPIERFPPSVIGGQPLKLEMDRPKR